VVGLNSYDDAHPDNVADDQGHGTFCAGIIGASEQTGVNKKTSMIPIKFLSSGGCGTVSDAIDGIDFAIQEKASVISASWGAVALSPELEKKIDDAGQYGILFVAGAGNEKRNLDKTPFFPAAYNLPNILSVGGIDDNDTPVPDWGSGTSKVHLSAPGVTVLSTKRFGRFGVGHGTSASTAYVAGAAGLVKSANMSWEFKEIKQRLITTAFDPLGHIHGTGASASEGRLDLARAVLGATP